MSTIPMIIDGQPVVTGTTLGVIDPATGEVFAEVAAGTAVQVDAAVAAAQAAFPAWRDTDDAERQRLLHEIGNALQANMPALMELVTKESGKPIIGLNGVGSAWKSAARSRGRMSPPT